MLGLASAGMQAGDWPEPLALRSSSGCDLLLQPEFFLALCSICHDSLAKQHPPLGYFPYN